MGTAFLFDPPCDRTNEFLNEFRVTPSEVGGSFNFWHKPCGVSGVLLSTQTVGLDTLMRIANEHECGVK
jgi:hypothetical protein